VVLSISNLLTLLIGRVPGPPPVVPLAEEDVDQRRIPTTIRLEPNVKAFIERHAAGTGLSIQDFISMTLRAVMVASDSPKLSELDLVVSRFFDLFESYQVNTVDIPLFLPESRLKRADLEHRDRVLNVLDRDTIGHLAKTFMVNPTWLNGTSSQCVEHSQIGRWYKAPANFARALLKFKYQDSVKRMSVTFVTNEHVNLDRLDEARREEDSIGSVDVTPVISLSVQVAGVEFEVFEIWERQRWNYINCRLGLKAMIMFCEKARVSVDGISLPQEKYRDFIAMTALPSSALTRPYRTWKIEDVVWDSDQNLERAELEEVTKYYTSESLPCYEKALSGWDRPTNLDRVLAIGELPKFGLD